MYALEDLETVSEISESMNDISILAKLYRHVHVELKSVMKTEEYVETYKGYMEKTEKYRTFLRNGRAKVKLLAKAEKEMNEEKVANERRMEEEKVLGAKERKEQKVRKGIEIEEQIFQEKLDSEIENFGEVKEIDEIKANWSRFEILSDDYYKLLARAKLAFDQAFVKEYKEIFDNTLYKIREQIKTGKLRIKELIAENEGNIAVEKARNNKLAEETFLKEQKFSAEILSNEIEMRSNALVEKCGCVAVESLSDYQVLQRSCRKMWLCGSRISVRLSSFTMQQKYERFGLRNA